MKWLMEHKYVVIIGTIAVFMMAAAGATVYVLKNNKIIEASNQYVDEHKDEDFFDIGAIIDLLRDDDEEELELEESEEVQEEIADNKDKKSEKKSAEKKKDSKTAGGPAYYVKVNNQANVVTVYGKDANGLYTVPVKAMICSTGSATPRSGKYSLHGKKRRWANLYGGVYGQYTTNIVGGILFHSVPYAVKGDPSSLIGKYYDQLGIKASAGCVRLTTIDAMWVYNNIFAGTTVEFYSDSNPGPLGKPSARKILGSKYPNWDPTDPDPRNPWKNVDMQAPVASVTYSTTNRTNQNVTVTISANEKIQGVNGWSLSSDGLKLTKTYETNGAETVTLKDLADNSINVSVKVDNIDKVAPKVNVTISPESSTDGEVVAIITANEQLQASTGWILSTDKLKLSKTFTENGTEVVTIRDLAGNVATVNVEVINIVETSNENEENII